MRRHEGTTRGQQGFTLIEIVVVSAIFIVIFGALMGFFSYSTRASVKGNNTVHAMRDLNMIFSRIRDDLGSIVLDEPVNFPGGLTVEPSIERVHTQPTADVPGKSLSFSFFKVYDFVPETLQPVAGKIVYSIVGDSPPYSLERAVYKIEASGISSTPQKKKLYCMSGLNNFAVTYYSRDTTTGEMTEIADDELHYNSPVLPDCFFIELNHKNMSRIAGYVTVTSPYLSGNNTLERVASVNNWMFTDSAAGTGTSVNAINYNDTNSINIGGTGIVLSSANLN